jgi:hypothetical protein
MVRVQCRPPPSSSPSRSCAPLPPIGEGTSQVGGPACWKPTCARARAQCRGVSVACQPTPKIYSFPVEGREVRFQAHGGPTTGMAGPADPHWTMPRFAPGRMTPGGPTPAATSRAPSARSPGVHVCDLSAAPCHFSIWAGDRAAVGGGGRRRRCRRRCRRRLGDPADGWERLGIRTMRWMRGAEKRKIWGEARKRKRNIEETSDEAQLCRFRSDPA